MAYFSWFVKNVSYPVWMAKDRRFPEWKNRNFYDYLNTITYEDLKISQLERLKNHLLFAQKTTKYYSQLFQESGFDPVAIKSVDELIALPVLTKQIIRERTEDLLSSSILPNDRLLANTGGSTGSPLVFFRDRESVGLRRGQEVFFDKWMGMDLGVKSGLFVSAAHFDGIVSSVKAKFRNATCERMIRFDPHNITDEYMEKFYKDFVSFKPDYIRCFPNSLMVFCDFIKRKGYRVPKVKSISCTGENLYDYHRQLFTEIFDAEVFEKVGTRESGVFACECENHEGLHVFSEGVVLEIIGPEGNRAPAGQMGKVYITDLLNRAMPLIRYELGDVAIPLPDFQCSCGSPLPKIQKWLGRDRDIVIDDQGNPKPGYLFTEVVMELNCPGQIQIHQVSRERLVVRITEKKSELWVEDILRAFKKIVGQGVEIEVVEVKTIPRDPSGKFSYVKSDVSFIDSRKEIK